MLSEKMRKKLVEAFQALSKVDRQLLALRSICCHYMGSHAVDKAYITAIVNHSEPRLTEATYRSFASRMVQFGFSEKKTELVVHQDLHHALLVLMSTDDMVWVYKMVDVLYSAALPDFNDVGAVRNQSNRIRARLVKAVYANDPDYFLAHHDKLTYCNKLIIYLFHIFGQSPIDLSWLASRHPVIRSYIMIALLRNYYSESPLIVDNLSVLALFRQSSVEAIEHDYLNYYSALVHLALGELPEVMDYALRIKTAKTGFVPALHATVSFLRMEFDEVHGLYKKALASIRKNNAEKNSYYFDNLLGLFHNFSLCCLDKNTSQMITNSQNYSKYAGNDWALEMQRIYSMFPLMKDIESGHQEQVEKTLEAFSKKTSLLINPMLYAFYQLLRYMANTNHIAENQVEIYHEAQKNIKSNHLLAAHLLYELLAKTKSHEMEAEAFLDASPIKLRLLNQIEVKEQWEHSFQVLEGLLLEGGNHLVKANQSKRLLWLLDPDHQQIEVIEQVLMKSGAWSRGRAVSLAKLKHHQHDDRFDYLTPQDMLAIHGITEERDGWYGTSYDINPYVTILALINSPHVAHLRNRDIALELVLVEPELHIDEKDNGYHLSLSHYLSRPGLFIEPETMSKYRVTDFSQAFVSIGQVLTPKGLTIPASAKEKVMNVIQNAKRDIKIHAGIKDLDIPERAGDPSPCIQLLPTKEGVRATLWVKPSPEGAYFKAAHGKESLMVLLNEEGKEVRARIHRDFSLEKTKQKQLIAKCPSLAQHEYDTGEYEIEAPEDVLEVLSEIQQHAETQPMTIEWPQGQTFKIKQRLSGKHMSLNIKSENSWFEFDGKVTLDDGEVLEMQALLESLDGQSYGRFVRLANGEFIELTSQLKKQLSVLQAISDDKKINPLGAQVLSDIVAQVEQTTFDSGWEVHLKKIKSMRNHAPKVPSTLQASLRDYQVEGFQYLSRLTHWGIGACLADDMGLGKTVQTIALLLERSKQGASLVIAPTSVCFNWMEELAKFAPTLVVHDLRADDRVGLIKKASKFDVIICSYGLLQHNHELLTEKHWETIVLDEAQAIKNAQTQRWKTVMKLKASNRIALSGTPIENHLGELWSIFSFINPGLLGSIKSFQNKYSTPIETKQVPERIHALRTLVQPYILRRIKSDVLTELPAKTEQTIRVEPSKEETAFYEVLRRKAEERMVNLMAENDRIGVLAEITKLRQACCDSSLVDASIKLENSKLTAFIETLKSIIDNGHKALVFSQYVRFLDIVKARVEAENISYQYLDGSTSASNRKKSVEAFQSGEGDVFLLSLKAGGSGLNLTAADYVIHLDPWWNPAVEDQASDRAHRIGQERPVTVYRFVMQNTIEEKIISLHEHKRNLANDLLSGQGISGKLSNQDLMQLISQGIGVS